MISHLFFYDDIAIDRELPSLRRRIPTLKASDVEIPTLRSTISDVNKRVTVVQVSTEAVALKGSWNKTGSASD